MKNMFDFIKEKKMLNTYVNNDVVNMNNNNNNEDYIIYNEDFVHILFACCTEEDRGAKAAVPLLNLECVDRCTVLPGHLESDFMYFQLMEEWTL